MMATVLRSAGLLWEAAVLACALSGCGASANDLARDPSHRPRDEDVAQFSAADVHALIDAARNADPIPEDQGWASRSESGWRKSTRDPGRLVAAFPALHLREGYELGAYEHWPGGNARGLVFAIPAGGSLPDVAHDADEPPTPPDALEHFMLAIEGDGTLASYLQASVLSRELDEFAARWHGVYWGLHDVVDEGCEGRRCRTTFWLPNGEKRRRCKQKVRLPEGEGWMPRVERVGNEVRVVFKAHVCVGLCEVVRFVDVYAAGSYRWRSQRQTLAECGGGFAI